MALIGSGLISLNDIRVEFGGGTPIGLASYYRGGGLVSTLNTFYNNNIPTGGLISLSNFYLTGQPNIVWNMPASPASTTINEGDTLYVTVTAYNCPGVTISLTGLTIGSLDFSDWSPYSSYTIPTNSLTYSQTFSITALADLTTDGYKSYILALNYTGYLGIGSGANYAAVYVNDTSQTPIPAPTISAFWGTDPGYSPLSDLLYWNVSGVVSSVSWSVPGAFGMTSGTDYSTVSSYAVVNFNVGYSGVYTAYLTVTGPGGSSSTTTSVTIIPRPVPISYNDLFYSSSSYVKSGYIAAYGGPDPIYVYFNPLPDTFTASLAVLQELNISNVWVNYPSTKIFHPSKAVSFSPSSNYKIGYLYRVFFNNNAVTLNGTGNLAWTSGNLACIA